MDFQLTDEHVLIKNTVREFAEKEIAPRAEEIDATDEFPADIFQRMAELGLLGIPFAETYGGAGGDYLSLLIALEEIAAGLRHGRHHPGCPHLAVLRADLPFRHARRKSRNTCLRC